MAEYSYGGLSIRVTADTSALRNIIARDATQAGQAASRSLSSTLGRGVTDIARSTGRALGTTFAVAGGAAVAFGTQVVRAGISYNTLYQRSRAAFQTILGSGDAANKMMKDLTEFAKTSPFPRQAFIEATQMMLAFGFEAKAVIPTLDAVQNAVAATGGTSDDIMGIVEVLSKVQSSGKFSAVTLNQLGIRGINAAQLIGQGMGKTEQEIRDSITAGTLDARKALTVLVEQMQKQYGGAAEGLKNTWVGAVDRVKGAMRDVGSAIVEPFISKQGGGYALEWANKFADLLRALEPAFTPFVQSVMTRMRPVFDALNRALDVAIKHIKDMSNAELVRWFHRLVPFVGLAAGGLLAFAGASGSVLQTIPVIGPVLGALAGPFSEIGKLALNLGKDIAGKLIPALGGGGKALAGLTGPIGLAVLAFGLLLAVSPELRAAVMDVVRALVEALKPAFQAIWEGVKGLLPPFIEMAKVVGGALAEGFKALVPVIQALAPIVAGALRIGFQLLGVAVSILAPVVTVLASGFANLMRWAQPLTPIIVALVVAFVAFKTVMAVATLVDKAIIAYRGLSSATTIAAAKQWLLNFAMSANPLGVVIMLVGALVGVFIVLYQRCDWFRRLADNMWNGFLNGVRWVVGAVQTLWRWIVGGSPGLIPAFQLLGSIVGPVIDGIRNGFRVLVSAVQAVVSGMIRAWEGLRAAMVAVTNGIVGAVVGAWNGLRAAVIAVVTATVSGVVGAWNGLRAAVVAVVTATVNGVVAAWNGLRAAVVAVVTATVGAVVGAWNGLQRAVVAVVQATVGAVVRAWDGLRTAVVTVVGGTVGFIIGTWNTIQRAVTSVVSATVGAVARLWDALRATVTSIMSGLATFLSRIWDAIRSSVSSTMQALATFIVRTWDAIRAAVSGIVTALARALAQIWGWIRDTVASILSAMQRILRAAWDWMHNLTRQVWSNILSFFQRTWDNMRAALGSAVTWLGNTLRAAWDFALRTTRDMWGRIGRAFFDAWENIKDVGRRAWEWLTDQLGRAWERIRSNAADMWGRIASAIGESFKAVCNLVADPIRWVVDNVVNRLIGGVNALITKVGIDAIPNVPNIPRFAQGGRVPGGYGGGDKVLARLEPGEWVLTKKQARAIGYGRLAGLPRYQQGGPVGIAPVWNPIDAAKRVAGLAKSAWDSAWGFTKEITHIERLGELGAELIDEFSGMLRWAAAAAFRALTEPLKKLLEPFTTHSQVFPTQWSAKFLLDVIDKTADFIEGKSAPDFMGSGQGIDALAAEVMERFPGLRITSGYRPGSITASGGLSYHARDMARDLAGPVPLMSAAGRWMQENMWGDLLEGIFNPTLAVKNYQKFNPPGPYGGVVWAGHADHIHMAAEKEGRPDAPGASSGSPGGGVGQWTGLVNRIAAQVGFPQQYLSIFMRQMQSESGGRNVVQEIRDINVGINRARGLMQVTWMAAKDYYPPARGMSPDQINQALMRPEFNIAASMMYMMRRYAGRIPQNIGRGHGYARGGIIREPVVGFGSRSGDRYTIAERGPELISPLTGRTPQVGRGWEGVTINVYPQPGQSEEQIAAAVSRELQWAYAGGRA